MNKLDIEISKPSFVYNPATLWDPLIVLGLRDWEQTMPMFLVREAVPRSQRLAAMAVVWLQPNIHEAGWPRPGDVCPGTIPWQSSTIFLGVSAEFGWSCLGWSWPSGVETKKWFGDHIWGKMLRFFRTNQSIGHLFWTLLSHMNPGAKSLVGVQTSNASFYKRCMRTLSIHEDFARAESKCVVNGPIGQFLCILFQCELFRTKTFFGKAPKRWHVWHVWPSPKGSPCLPCLLPEGASALDLLRIGVDLLFFFILRISSKTCFFVCYGIYGLIPFPWSKWDKQAPDISARRDP